MQEAVTIQLRFRTYVVKGAKTTTTADIVLTHVDPLMHTHLNVQFDRRKSTYVQQADDAGRKQD